jgi:hypothetical protein
VTRPFGAGGLEAVVDMEQSQVRELSTRLDERVRENRGIESAAECDGDMRLRAAVSKQQ